MVMTALFSFEYPDVLGNGLFICHNGENSVYRAR